jgi:hypothetical protein
MSTPVRSTATIAILVGLVLAACGTAGPTPGPTEAAAPAGPVVGCMSIEAAECLFVAERVVAALPAARGRPFAVEITLFPCDRNVDCPRSLAARAGRALVEYPGGGEPIDLRLSGPPQDPEIVLQENHVWSEPVQPTSARVNGPGPFPFDLGHCGLSHVIDFDGSFWVPLGPVDGDASGMINSESGQMRLLAPNLAVYVGAGGFTAQLARFPGPKRFFLCD